MVRTDTGLEEQQDIIRNYLQESARIKALVADACHESILESALIIIHAFQAGAKVLLCGNGGSAADCQHFATELVSRLSSDIKRRALPALALTTDTSFLTAYSNDAEFDGIFERQVEAFGKPGDVLIAISTSGNSKNVIRAVEQANKLDMVTISLTGQKGVLKDITDSNIMIPSENTQFIQESHLAIEHVICYLVEDALFRQTKSQGAYGE